MSSRLFPLWMGIEQSLEAADGEHGAEEGSRFLAPRETAGTPRGSTPEAPSHPDVRITRIWLIIMTSLPAQSVDVTFTRFRSRCTCHVSCQRCMRRGRENLAERTNGAVGRPSLNEAPFRFTDNCPMATIPSHPSPDQIGFVFQLDFAVTRPNCKPFID